MAILFKQIFIWWLRQTWGTRFFTFLKGHKVGEDSAGNIFYQTRDKRKRWVIYAGLCDPSFINAQWFGWLHHTVQECPSSFTGNDFRKYKWEVTRVPNLTGTCYAYRPDGSLFRASNNSGDSKTKTHSFYMPWGTNSRNSFTPSYSAWNPSGNKKVYPSLEKTSRSE